MRLEEEVIALRAEVVSLKEQLAQALAVIAQLQEELDKYKSEPPSFIKPNTSKLKEKAEKQPRRKRAKEQNGARRREQSPTQTIQHQIEECPDCGYSLGQAQLAGRRQVIELPAPQSVEVTEHQLYKSWCARCSKWRYPPLQVALPAARFEHTGDWTKQNGGTYHLPDCLPAYHTSYASAPD